jgi:alpha-tubulin suppressor-like RCC1 family protein
VRRDGTVWCWGYNYYGQLGDRTGTNRTTPVQVQNLFNVRQVSAGGHHTCALRTDGLVWCWGYNNYGQLGDGEHLRHRSYPVPVPGLSGVVELIARRQPHVRAAEQRRAAAAGATTATVSSATAPPPTELHPGGGDGHLERGAAHRG